MTVAELPAETADLDAFRAELERIMAGAPVATSKPAPETNEPSVTAELDPATPETRSGPPVPVAYQPTIRDLPACERPRERLREHGPRYLNNAELVAILLRSGIAGENAVSVAMRVIAEFDGPRRTVARRLRRTLRPAWAQRRENLRDHGRAGVGTTHLLPRSRRAVPGILSPGRRQPGLGGAGIAGAGKPGRPVVEHAQPGRGPPNHIYWYRQQQCCASRGGCCDRPSGKTPRPSSWSTTIPPVIQRPAQRMWW